MTSQTPIDITRVQQVLANERQFDLSLAKGDILMESDHVTVASNMHVYEKEEEVVNRKSKFNLIESGSPKIVSNKMDSLRSMECEKPHKKNEENVDVLNEDALNDVSLSIKDCIVNMVPTQ